MLVKLCFSLNLIPVDPDPRTQLNASPTGSGSTSLVTLTSRHLSLRQCIRHKSSQMIFYSPDPKDGPDCIYSSQHNYTLQDVQVFLLDIQII